MVSLENQIDFNDGKMDIPMEFTQSMMHSNDLDVLKKVQRELIPREMSSFGHQTAAGVVSTSGIESKLTFYASDPRMYMDLLNSYFTADFRAVATKATDANANNAPLGSFMDVGGIHSCIKTLTIKIGGTVMMRLDDYNKWYNINNLATHSAEYADYMLGPSLDSQDDYILDANDFWEEITITNIANTKISVDGLIDEIYVDDASSLGDTNGIRSRVAIGDIVRVSGATAPQVGQVRALGAFTTAANGTITIGNAAATFTAQDPIDKFEVRRRATRSYAVNQAATTKIQWRLPVGCLSFFKYFPLPYIQNIAPLEVEFEFIDSRLALCLREPTLVNLTNRFGYLVSRPRWIAMLVEPSNKVREIHDSLYNSNGLWFPYLNYRHFSNELTTNNTDATLTFQTNISSARHALTVITAKANDDVSAAAVQAVKSQSTFYRSQLNYFRFQSGSLQFPDYGNCQVVNFMAAEAWAQLLLAFNIKENTVIKSRIRPHEWQSINSDKFIIGTSLSKDDSIWTGTSLKNNFLELTLNKAAVAVAYNTHTYLGYDCALVISRQSGCNVFD